MIARNCFTNQLGPCSAAAFGAGLERLCTRPVRPGHTATTRVG